MQERSPVGVEWERWSTDMHLLVTEPSELAAARAIVDSVLDAVDRAASRFRPDSEVSALARAGGMRTPVSETLADLIAAALTAARVTGGAVDPTVGSAMIELGYDSDVAGITPASPQLVSIAQPVDWTHIEFDGHSVRMPTGTVLDLGATAKAVAADRCAQHVHEQTGTGVLVNLGGDIATAGPTPEGDWRVAVQDTDEDRADHITLGAPAGLATSSTRRRRWQRAGRELHHILDPRTGTPADPVWRTVSVGANTCLAANTFSTAAIVLGAPAPQWIAGLGFPARFVGRDGAEVKVGGWPEEGRIS